MTFAEQLKSERTRLGLSQAECAKALDLSKRWVETVEKGESTPKLVMQEGVLARLAKLPTPEQSPVPAPKPGTGSRADQT